MRSRYPITLAFRWIIGDSLLCIDGNALKGHDMIAQANGLGMQSRIEP
jgi:hypothetical protein